MINSGRLSFAGIGSFAAKLTPKVAYWDYPNLLLSRFKR